MMNYPEDMNENDASWFNSGREYARELVIQFLKKVKEQGKKNLLHSLQKEEYGDALGYKHCIELLDDLVSSFEYLQHEEKEKTPCP